MIGLIISSIALFILALDLVKNKRKWESLIMFTLGIGFILTGIVEATFQIWIAGLGFFIFILIEFKDNILWLLDKVLGTELLASRRKYE